MLRAYAVAREVLERGFSRGACLMLAAVTGVMSVLMALLGALEQKPAFFLFSAFCLAIVLCCVCRGSMRRVAARCVAAIVFLISLGYFIEMVCAGPVMGSSPGDASLYKAICLLIAVGIPALCYACRGTFRWRKRRQQPAPAELQ